VDIDPSLQRFMFTLFIYSLGFSVAPQFFASVDRTTWTWNLLVIVEVVLIIVVVFVAAYLFICGRPLWQGVRVGMRDRLLSYVRPVCAAQIPCRWP
jgi:uncharacterized transporter YbjL